MKQSFRYQIVGSHGDLEAWGAAFNYRYNAVGNALAVYRNESGCTTLNITLPAKIADNPLLFIQQLEKATQIRALMLSSNATLRLCQTIVPEKLTAIARGVSKLALNCYDLRTDRIEKFTKLVRRSYGLKEFEISHIGYEQSGTKPYYKAKIVSCRDHCVVVREDNIHSLLKRLSDGIISDLITLEFSSRNNHCSEQLLRLATRLSVMSKIIDDRFDPANFVMIQSDSTQNRIQ